MKRDGDRRSKTHIKERNTEERTSIEKYIKKIQELN